MSILHRTLSPITGHDVGRAYEPDERYSRDALGDLKHGMDLIFQLKSELDKLHPVAADTVIQLLAN